jgi:hypothetical protein
MRPCIRGASQRAHARCSRSTRSRAERCRSRGGAQRAGCTGRTACRAHSRDDAVLRRLRGSGDGWAGGEGWASATLYRALYRSSNRRRDTIGTLAPLALDIISLFPARHCHGGAPRGERPASWDARRLARRLACRVMCTPHGCSAEHPNVSRRSAHPYSG